MWCNDKEIFLVLQNSRWVLRLATDRVGTIVYIVGFPHGMHNILSPFLCIRELEGIIVLCIDAVTLDKDYYVNHSSHLKFFLNQYVD
jgi:hypothetical protein